MEPPRNLCQAEDENQSRFVDDVLEDVQGTDSQVDADGNADQGGDE